MDVLEPLMLRPGDRRIRAVVREGTPPGDDPWRVEQLCARCGRAIAVGSTALVVYGAPDSTDPDTAALCRSCAAMLTPFRFAIDLARLRSLNDPEAVCREVARHVGCIVILRAGPPSDVVWIRAADAHGLARRLAITRTHLALRLRDLDVLVGIDVATRERPGTARRSREVPRAHARRPATRSSDARPSSSTSTKEPVR